MKTKKTMKAVLSLVLSIVMILATMVPIASAVSIDESKLGTDTYLTSKTDYVLAPGITESKITTNNSTGTNQNVAYAVEVDISNPTTSVIASYKNYDGSKLGFQKVRDQAYAAESKRDVNVVAGTNADFFNMQTGETHGALVMNGTTYHSASGRPYFGITTEGKAVIRTGKLKSDIVEAVGGLCILVENGEVTQEALVNDYGTYTAPRTAVGITAEGNVILYVVDGRQAPYSTGLYFDELAEALCAIGCETALCLDGGGSSTYVSQHEGETDLVCRNSPSDGSERTVSSSLLICSTAKPSGVFNHASLSPNNELYTPGSTVTFTAKGVDSAGYAAELPADGTFALADESTGTIDPVTGVFTAAENYVGEVTVNYMADGVASGSTTIEIVVPDELYVANTEQAVGPGVTTDFGIVAKYQNRDVIMQNDDIEWEILTSEYQEDVNKIYAYFYKDGFDSKYLTNSTYGTKNRFQPTEITGIPRAEDYVVLEILAATPDKGTKYKIDYLITNKLDGFVSSGDLAYYSKYKNVDVNGVAGTFDGLTFTGAEDGAYNTNVTATLKCNTALTLDLTVFIGSKQSLIYDFEYVTGEENKDAENYIPSFSLPTYGKKWLADNGSSNAAISAQLYEEGMPLYMWPNGAIANDTVSADIVTAADGEPVRFGDKALRISFDFSTYNKESNGNFYLRVTEPTYRFEGSPTAMGVWVYAPEGTAPYHLYLNCGSKIGDANSTSYQCLTTSDNMGTESGGINWTGWRYLEFDLTGLKGRTGVSNVGGSFEPYGFYQSCGVFWISYQPSNMGADVTSDTIYIDDITLIYGANTSDTLNPKVNYLGDINSAIVDGETVYTSNTNTFKASFADVEDKYMTGIDDAATKMYIDGVDVTDKCYINEGDDEIYFYDAVLSDGIHNIEVEVSDVFGNKTTEMKYFTIDSGAEDTEVSFVAVDGAPVLGMDYELAITSDNVADVTSADVKVKVLSDFTSYWRDVTVVPAANYELDGEAVYNSINDTLSFKVVRKADASAENDNGTIATIVTAVPTNVPENLEVTHRIAKGALTLASESADNYTAAFSGKITYAAISPFVLSTDTMIIGADGGYIYITDNDAAPVEGANIYLADGTLIGTTDAEGKLYTDLLISSVAEFSIYAEKDGLLSFIYKSQSYNAGGDTTGAPSYIKLNAAEDASTQQNISWMASPVASADKAIVKYATKADYEANGDATVFTEFEGKSYVDTAAASGKTETNYAVRFNSAVITGLAPATEYVYMVGDGTNWSDVRRFTTDRAGTNTNFFVMGDTQSADTSNLDAIFSQLAASETDYTFGIQTGDAVDNAGSYSYWEGIGGAFSGDYIGEIDMVHVLGNHEFTGDAAGINAAHYFNLPGTTDQAPLAYSFEYGNVYVAAFKYLSGSEAQAAADWLVEDAAKSTANWKILAMHQPPYFTNIGGGTTRAMMDKITAAVDAADIDFVFAGHDHTYARTYPITAGEQSADGAVYFICAATSAEKGYQITTVPGIHEIASDEYNSIYLTVSTTDTTCDITVWNYDGTDHNVFDSYSATKTVDCSENGHVNKFDGEYLTCKVCGYTTEVGTYSGFVTDAETDLPMYLIGGNVQTGWVAIGEDNYIFGEDGVALTGTVTYEGFTYEFGEDGKLKQGAFVKNDDGTYSYYINGIAQRGWFEIDGYWYYFSRTIGFKTLSGEKSVEGMMYKFAKDGKLVRGAFNETPNGTAYYWGPYPVTGLVEIEDNLYYFDPADTYMLQNESVEIDGEIYSFYKDGTFTHYGEHFDEDGDGDCDECPVDNFFTRLLKSILDFFKRIREFFESIFSA